jgi:hypothetical protein
MKIYAIIDGTEYDLNYGDPAKFEGEDDLGMPDLHRMEERGPMQHGSTDRGYRLDPRYATYVFGIFGQTRAQLWDRRREISRIFRPSRMITMKHVLDNDEIRYLDCYVAGGMKMPAQDRKGGIFQKVAVMLKADDPTFYDPVADEFIFPLVGGENTCDVPTVIPMTIGIGASSIYITEAFPNNGDVSAFPIIRLTGPITDAKITNNSTGEVLDFDGTTIAVDHYFDIDLRYGYKRVIDNHDVVQTDKLSSDSDLVTWHLADDSEIADGINSVTLYGTGMSDASGIGFVWYTRYLGL